MPSLPIQKLFFKRTIPNQPDDYSFHTYEIPVILEADVLNTKTQLISNIHQIEANFFSNRKL